MFGVLTAWLVEIGIVTWRDITKPTPTNNVAGLPIPSDYLATFVVFGSLAALSEVQAARTTASLAAWGFVLATVLNVVDPTDLIGGKPKATTNVDTGAPQTGS